MIKVGGLADVAGSLPKALAQLGHDVRVVLPRYGRIDGSAFGVGGPVCSLKIPMLGKREDAHVFEGDRLGDVAVSLIGSEHYFDRENVYGYTDDDERFVFFNKAIVQALEKLAWRPDVVHCNDWHSALVPDLLRALDNDDIAATASVLTIHNLAHQGPFKERTLEAIGTGPDDSSLNLMARGILSADVINTVSSRYATEILTPTFGAGLDSLLRDRRDVLFGILNGLDYEEFCPSTDPHLACRYDAHSFENRGENKRALQEANGLTVDPNAPLLGTVCRLDAQKGLDLIASIMDDLIELGVQFIAMGIGDPHYERMMRDYASKYRHQVAYRSTSEEAVARKIYSGVDFLLAPSKFEPCGLSPLIALRYGAIPVVRATGGMAETIIDHDRSPGLGLGFVFDQQTPSALLGAVRRALNIYRSVPEWDRLVARVMTADFSWDGPACEYERLYTRALEIRGSETLRTVGMR